MTDERWQRAKQLFHDALDRTGRERERFLALACGDDTALRAQVDALLAAHDEASEFLASPTFAGTDEAAKAAAGVVAAGPPEGPGSRIGPYKLLQRLGEGGFGVVYMADQEEPIRRRVALKIIKLGMDTKEVIARFEAERQALALMDHPNIARVLDAGATASGRPYFVMELVKGVPITDYCDAHRLSTRERLDLFLDVCRAVHHAHEKGIIHRDIKPSNVLVTLHDGTPVPKVIDFGVAKATNQRLTEKTLFTAYGEFVGTPVYMSPEQAELSGLEIDRRSDIYALGVLLYELLTGTTPFEPETLRSLAFFEMLRVIREEDPPTLSSRLSTLGERLVEVASRRQVEPGGLTKLVRGDLDCIVAKAMEKDRKRRYTSASELADDVGRYFRHEVVNARAPGAVYRLRKFAKRRRGRIVAAAGITAAAVLGGSLARIGGVALDGSVGEAPTTRLVFDWPRDTARPVPMKDGRHGYRYDAARRGYEIVDITSGRPRRFIPAHVEHRLRLWGYNDAAPDGRAIALFRWAGPEAGEDSMQVELRLFSVGGTAAGRLLHRWPPGVQGAVVFGWSPDQRRVWVYLMHTDATAEISSIDIANGARQVLRTLAWRNHTQPPSLSPDGRFITYHDSEGPGSPADIFLVRADGSNEIRIEHPARDALPLFTPDGAGIVFWSSRKGGDLWFLRVVGGRPAADPRPIWGDVGPYGQAMQFAANGSLFYYFAGSGWELYTADLDPGRGRSRSPEHIEPRSNEGNTGPAFSPDGTLLAHLRGRGRRLVLRDLATGVEREFPIAGTLNVPTIDFCPDGKSLVITGYDGASGQSVFRADLQQGGAERLPVEPEAYAPVLCLDGGREILYHGARQPDEPSRIVRRSLATGEETTLYASQTARLEARRSLDGSSIAILAAPLPSDVRMPGEVQLVVLPLDGRAPVTLPESWTRVHGFAWFPDGRALLVARAADHNAPAAASPEIEFWRVPIDGTPAIAAGSMRLPAYEKAIYGSRNYSVHPDGSRIVFERHAGLVSQVWAIDNLLAFIQSGASATVRELSR